jgi:sugar lactone lactonase YvrE
MSGGGRGSGTFASALCALALLLELPARATAGIITTTAGNGTAAFGGDGGPSTGASLNQPTGVAVDSEGNFFIADQINHRIRRVDADTREITTVAGTGDPPGFGGDAGPATLALLQNPRGVALDAAGNLFIVDLGNQRIRRVEAGTGIITTVAGNGTRGYNGDGIAATAAELRDPRAVVIDSGGNLFIADQGNLRVRRVDASTQLITTYAGIGFLGVLGDGGPAASATLQSPFGLALDASENLYIADQGGNRIRRIDRATGIISTYAGTGTFGFAGDAGPATEALFFFPSAVALDASGNLFVADLANQRVRRVDAATGIITTHAGTGTLGFAGDGDPATSAQLYNPFGVAVDPLGEILIADTGNQRIRRVGVDCVYAAGDRDCDGLPDAVDRCPFLAGNSQADTDGDGRGDDCECGDQDGDGRNTVSDLVAINAAIFTPSLATPLCDANGDALCNVSDIISTNVEIFSPANTSICAFQPVPGP